VTKGFVLFLIVSTASSLWCAEPGDGTVRMEGNEIFARLEKENEVRSTKLRGYSSIRRYSVYERNKPTDAETKVKMDYVSPSTKKFQVLSKNGAGWIDNWVFRSLIRAEQEAASEKRKAESAIGSANYEAKLIGQERSQGRDCYLLELHPKRRDKFLIDGKIWVDKEDFAIVKLAGEPAKSLSFWVTQAHLVREYQKIGDFWLQSKDETNAQIRVVGEYIMKIEYSDYAIKGDELPLAGKGEADNLPVQAARTGQP
jgi:outer membrane lipoprotein-sorting protein